MKEENKNLLGADLLSDESLDEPTEIKKLPRSQSIANFNQTNGKFSNKNPSHNHHHHHIYHHSRHSSYDMRNSKNFNNITMTNGSLANGDLNNSGSGGDRKKKKASAENDPLAYDLTKYFNLKNAKILALVLIVLFVLYHGSLNSLYGRSSCNRLLGEGHLKSDNQWQPFGCMLHKYSKE